ncbi:CoA transferase, partial [Solihabitans fulvus]
MGPLAGLRVVELVGLGPAPFGCMVLADLGAEVIRVDRARAAGNLTVPGDFLARGRRSIGVDIKQPQGAELVLRLVERADVLVEGFRPGVTERLGLGPAQCLARNTRLVYGRMTGWGQDGPMADRAGHDINYIAVAGALEPIGPADRPPVPPLNLIGDFGGGGMLLAMGVLAALYERERSGRGQVVDAAMVDGAALLTTVVHSMRSAGAWPGARGANLLDGGAPFYDTYAAADGRFVSIGALEEQFYAELVRLLGLDPADLPNRFDQANWPALRERIGAAVRTRTRDEWAALAA